MLEPLLPIVLMSFSISGLVRPFLAVLAFYIIISLVYVCIFEYCVWNRLELI
jgi:hypothetical protein